MVALNKQALGYKSANYQHLILSIDLATLYDASSAKKLHVSSIEGLTSS